MTDRKQDRTGLTGGFICPAPWHSVAVRNNGDYRLCCYANVSKGSGLLRHATGQTVNILNDSADEIRNHPSLKQVRKDFLAGQWPRACQRCKSEEAAGLSSGRGFYISRLKTELSHFQSQVEQGTTADGTIDENLHPVEDMDIRFGNQCNLSCRMCGPTDSSAWYDDHWALGNRTFNDSGDQVSLFVDQRQRVSAMTERFDWHQKIDLKTRLPSNLEKLRRIYIAGGEPLLIQAHQDFLNLLIEQNLAGQISLEYNTNLTVLPEPILNLWQSFREVSVGVSMDGYGPYHEYLRYPGRFSILERNLSRLDLQPANVRAWLACTVSILNVAHISDFMLWKWRKGFQKVGASPGKALLSTHQVHQPAHLDIRSFPRSAKKWAQTKLSQGILNLQAEAMPEAIREKSVQVLKGIESFMNSQDRSQNWSQHWQKTKDLDALRKQSFQRLEPELWQILESEALAHPEAIP